MTRAELDAVRYAIDAKVRDLTAGLNGTELDREPPHGACTLHREVRVSRPGWNGCAADETFVDAGAALLGARLAAVPLATGGAPPCPSVLFGGAA